ncbi:uncharacterized protein LOC107647107 [Arachis ipaensis]|uniref:uncharacterized protein LOC107647107 n=1 Tax=Arachis ipaensis TaxID=130454 RepID=UPI0007AF4453|nr:uncharacterized protein LOC107647107 [Arachis ipaensis]XP_025661716.1 uncharacterized protein LOC112757339 [Arachis hypogaea]
MVGSLPLQPFCPPRSEPRPEPQTANGVQVMEPCNEDMDLEVKEVDSFDEHIDRIFAASDAEKHKGRKTTVFWDVDLIDSDGIVKHAKMSVREAIEQSLNGSKIILRFNKKLQAVGDGAGLLSGILGALDSDYINFPICEKSWGKVQGKDMVYDDYIKNLNNRPEGIPREHWRWFIDYRNNPTTKAKCKQNALNRKKQLYTHTGGSKSLDRVREEKEKISEIEQLDETTRILSENDSLAQALSKEHSGRVHGIGFGPTPSQLFRPSAQPPVDKAQTEEAQRMLFELQEEVTAEKLRRKAVEDEVAAEKLKRKRQSKTTANRHFNRRYSPLLL